MTEPVDPALAQQLVEGLERLRDSLVHLSLTMQDCCLDFDGKAQSDAAIQLTELLAKVSGSQHS
jgi:hypothetical protein